MTLPLVLFHGFTGSPASWDDVLAHLPGRTALSPALLGHGANGASADAVRTFDDEVERLTGLFEAERVHLAGYSLGARLALGVLARHPERVARCTLVSAHPGLDSETERAERRGADAVWCELLETRGIEAFVDAWETQPLFASQAQLPADLRAWRRRERLAHDPRGLARSLRITGLGAMPDYRPLLAGVRAPVSVLAGERDPKFLTLGRRLSALFGARLTTLPKSGHDLLLERPDLVAVEIERELPA